VVKGSYYYLCTAFILFILALLIQSPIKRTLKIATTTILTFFAIFGFILALISLYASPLNYAEPYAAAIFFLAGMIGGSIIPMIKTEQSQEKINISVIHKTIRIILLIIIVLSLVRLVFNMSALLFTL
jgi:FtsH-binding integral membrane protein